jgi:hypothetical protein
VLPERYVALLAKRYVLDWDALGIVDVPQRRVIYPDVHVAERTINERSHAAEAGRDGGVAVAAPAVELPTPLPDEVPLLSVEIRDIAERRLVTLIELISPANRVGAGAREYADRRTELLRTQTHLLEIDLVRRGERIPLEGEPPLAPYYAYLSRAERRPLTAVWPIALQDRLPVLPLPLLAPDPDVRLDLQSAVDECFALVPYEELLDYSAPPPLPALDPRDAVWVREVLTDPAIRKGAPS